MVQPLHVIESVKNVKRRKDIGKLCTSQLNSLFADSGVAGQLVMDSYRVKPSCLQRCNNLATCVMSIPK